MRVDLTLPSTSAGAANTITSTATTASSARTAPQRLARSASAFRRATRRDRSGIGAVDRRRERAARRTAREMSVEQAIVDTGVLSVGARRDGVDPRLASHGSSVVRNVQEVPHRKFRQVPADDPTGSGMMRAVIGDPLRPLLDAAREGDDIAVRRLVRETQPMVWRVCTSLGSVGEEDDLVRETYLRALRSLEQYRIDAPVLPWLLSIARNVCADHVRRRMRQRRRVDRLTLHASERGTAVADGEVTQLVDRLSPDRREAFVLTQIVGLSYEEAATTLGCPIGTICSRVAPARGDLIAAVKLADAQ